jgi:hypothetical protein
MEKSKSMSGELLRAMADFTSSKITCVGTGDGASACGLIQRRPAVVEGFTAVPRKAVCQPRGRTPALDGVDG